MSKIKSCTDRSGMKTTHYDENGNKVGQSWASRSGGQITHYDADGNITGRSFKSPAGHMTHYDAHYHKTGHSQILHSGHVKHYDNDYNPTGDSYENFWGAKETDASQFQKRCAPSSSTASGCATLLFLAGICTLLLSILI